MERERSTTAAAQEPSAAPVAGGGVSRGLWWTRVRAFAVVLLCVLVLAIALDFATALPGLCGSCHEMEHRVASWEQSAHSRVACVDCHLAPTQWFALPQRLFDRGELLGRDTVRHLAGGYDDPVGAKDSSGTVLADDICLECHDANRKATTGFRILIEHAEHAERNGSCASCHVRTAHPTETRGDALSLMAQCFTCHGLVGEADASGECAVCHPGDYELRPASHVDANWIARHGTVSFADPQQCDLCHIPESCTECHGLEMPHPAGWASNTPGHVSVAESSRALCERCHGQQPDLCTVCHHPGYRPAQGTWVSQHPLDVTQRGTTTCSGCHTRAFCVDCHTR